MTTSTDANLIRVVSVRVTADRLEVDFEDGRTNCLPLAWYPRLQHGTPKERNTWQLIARGRGVHWPLLDEDLDAEGLLAGRKSRESETSFSGWLAARAKKSTRPRISRSVGSPMKSGPIQLARKSSASGPALSSSLGSRG